MPSTRCRAHDTARGSSLAAPSRAIAPRVGMTRGVAARVATWRELTNRATARSRSIDRAIASNLDARFDATTTLSIAIDDAAARFRANRASSLARARDGTRGAADAPTCVVLERDGSREARRQGYGVTLSETNAALAGLGVGEAPVSYTHLTLPTILLV